MNFKSITEELNYIMGKNNGLLEPAKVVEFAKSKKTLLHKKFEWDDSEAAQKYRLWQARRIITFELVVIKSDAPNPKHIFIPYNNDNKESNSDEGAITRAFVSLTTSRHGEEKGYRSIQSIVSDAQLREQLLKDAKSDMLSFIKKYKILEELANIFKEMQKFL